MTYLMIENPGVVAIEGLTVLGLSTARGDTDSIGQFGSGNKHAVNVFLRHNINPIIHAGLNKRIQFFTKQQSMKGKEYKQVYCQTNDEIEKCGWCAEFGELDWTTIDMGLREFISNALDQASDPTKVKVEVVNEIAPKRGYTRVYVDFIPAVKRYFTQLHNKFLHFTGDHKNEVLEKNQAGRALIYRKGVFVRQLSNHNKDSLFDYNLGDSLDIDEARNLSDYQVQDAVAELISSNEIALTAIFKALVNGEEVWERKLGASYYIRAGGNSALWKNVWQNVAGEDTVVTHNPIIRDHVRKNGFKVILIEKSDWVKKLVAAGIPDAAKLMTKAETKGYEMAPIQTVTTTALDTVWSWLVECGLTRGKTKPKLQCFTATMNTAGEMLNGYYEKGTIFINTAVSDRKQTILEECAHYITGASDMDRAFQHFAFQCAIAFKEMEIS